MNLLVAKEEQLLGEPPEARCAVIGTQPAPNSEKGGDEYITVRKRAASWVRLNCASCQGSEASEKGVLELCA